jgi:hypothetical protein
MTTRTFITLIALAGLLATPLAATAGQSSATRSANASVNVTSGLSLSKTQDLDFASIIPGATPGTVVVSPANVRTFTGPLTFGNGPTSNASFNVTSTGLGWSIVLPSSVTITGGASSMVVDNFNATQHWINAPTLSGIDIGATLHIGATQPVGTYAGTFDVTVTHP